MSGAEIIGGKIIGTFFIGENLNGPLYFDLLENGIIPETVWLFPNSSVYFQLSTFQCRKFVIRNNQTKTICELTIFGSNKMMFHPNMRIVVRQYRNNMFPR